LPASVVYYVNMTEEVNPHSQRPQWMVKTSDEPVVLTGRDYDTVLKNLRLPDYYFAPGVMVLSVGEGLSDFARRLHDERGVDIVAADPIYALGGDVLQSDPVRVFTFLKQKFGKHVDVDNAADPGGIRSYGNGGRDFGDRRFPLPDPGRIHSVSIYDLSSYFGDEAFDLIVSHKLFEHIDFERALPELFRVLKPAGEIRMFGLNLNVLTDSSVVLDSELIMENSNEGHWEPHPGLANAFDLPETNKLSMYARISSFPKAKIARHFPKMRTADMLILRMDKTWPGIAQDEPSLPNHIGDLVKIIPGTQHTDAETGQKAYKIEYKKVD
jgi:SAM-dependent methyltransferase